MQRYTANVFSAYRELRVTGKRGVKKNHVNAYRSHTVSHAVAGLEDRMHIARLLRNTERILLHSRKGYKGLSAEEVRRTAAKQLGSDGYLCRNVMMLAAARFSEAVKRKDIQNEAAYMLAILWSCILELNEYEWKRGEFVPEEELDPVVAQVIRRIAGREPPGVMS